MVKSILWASCSAGRGGIYGFRDYWWYLFSGEIKAALKGLLAYAHLLLFTFTQLDMSDPRGVQLQKEMTTRYFGVIIDNDATKVPPS